MPNETRRGAAAAQRGAGRSGARCRRACDSCAAVPAHWHGCADAEQPPADDEEGGGRGRGGPQTASMAAGVQRFTWDLQYAAGDARSRAWCSGARRTNGPMALPGTYQARLTVDGTPQTQPFDGEEASAGATISDADLQEQFELASRIRDKVNEANNAIIQIRRIKHAARRSDEARRRTRT